MSDTMTLVSEGERVVVGIELPKGKPDSPTRKVSFAVEGNQKYPPAGWIYADELGDITIGTLVSYRIEKNADGFNKITHLARSGSVQTGEGQSDQTPAHEAPSSGGRDDAVQGEGNADAASGQRTGTHRAPPPDGDLSRFESYAFLAACGMVDLAYEELSDAKNSGVIEAVNPSLVREVAEMFVSVADWGQRDLTGSVNRNAMSHTRARGAVRSALLSYPAREYVQDVREWREKLAKVATTLLKVAASL